MKNFAAKIVPFLLWSQQQRQYPMLAWCWLAVPISAIIELSDPMLSKTPYNSLFVIATFVLMVLIVACDAFMDKFYKDEDLIVPSTPID